MPVSGSTLVLITTNTDEKPALMISSSDGGPHLAMEQFLGQITAGSLPSFRRRD